MLEHPGDDVTQCMASFKANLANHVASLESHVKAYGKNVEVENILHSKMCCTLYVSDCPVDVELEIVPALSWNVKDGKLFAGTTSTVIAS